jgi:hypothetical protein
MTLDPKIKKKNKPKVKTTIGWREWVAFPDFGVDRIKAKIDTGARSSAMHAWNIQEFEQNGETWVKFEAHPDQRSNQRRLACAAEVVEKRKIRSSSGHHELRYVVKAKLEIANEVRVIELTLTNRDEMGFRVLLGRTALSGYYIVDPGRSYLIGK